MFNPGEHAVIRTYIAITGEAPTQAQFEAAFSHTGLRALSTELISARPAQSNSAFLTDLYEHLLNRAPDAEGFEYWTALMNGGELSQSKLATEFQNSAAVNAANEPGLVDGTPGLNPVDGAFVGYIDSAMADLRSDQNTESGLRSLHDDSVEIETMLSDGDVVEFSGDERAVIRVYVALTGEPPAQAELEAVFDDCSGFFDLCHDLSMENPELSDTEFVTMLYQNLLGREPDPDGLAYWSSLLDEASGRNQQSKWGLAGHFQNTAALNAVNESGLVNDTFDLDPTGETFRDYADDAPLSDPPPEDTLYLGEFADQELDLDFGRGEQVRLVYEGYDNGGVTVRNFVQDTDGQAGSSVEGIDHLDFRDYLVTWVELDTTCHPLSRAPVEFLGNADELVGNTVSIITFQGAGNSASQNWESLDETILVSLLNGTEAYGDAVNTTEFGDYDADNGGSAMDGYLGGIEGGRTNNHIFMVENDANAGEYKIFHVTSTRVDDSEAGNFDAGAKLIGVLDLGASLSTNEFDMENSLVWADTQT
ncbi:DUF4214 domain-containing protein [Marinobacter xestospongiae]|uniref:DUF4214 domain-containing protein n=1 Tax=Marinobacter xestospongiae TaxID=994319 RepID=A0ABU3W074_9GAMM|nr:DUF4214 domain-containing protein [Marinobacter xestospongiae]MDV2079930.1 DUF4214 domain-containing protein [Marinobacter xestospongiae]